jgi:SAM-dependent methyltransferase
MGITPLTIGFEKKSLKLADKKYSGLNWCELGCQKDMRYSIPSKLIYKKLGTNHTSIDLNGKFGSIKLDLSKDLPEKMMNHFDVITDYGTVEHITDQYKAFKNVHKICAPAGLMIHALPLKSNWKNHGIYEYTPEFFRSLAKICGYEVIDLEILNKDEFKTPYKILAVTFRKGNKSFPSKSTFEKLKLTETNFTEKAEDYERKGLYRVGSLLKTRLKIAQWKLMNSPL